MFGYALCALVGEGVVGGGGKEGAGGGTGGLGLRG